MADANASYYYLYDANGNVGQLVNAADGSIAAHYEYDPFGNLTAKSGPYADANPFRHATQYLDDETNLYAYKFRYYSPELGRWLSRDPIGEKRESNLYNYQGNDGINRYDLFGLWTVKGVLDILCKDSYGKRIVNEILSKSFVYKFETYTLEG